MLAAIQNTNKVHVHVCSYSVTRNAQIGTIATELSSALCRILHCESKKLCHFYFYCNFGKRWLIFKIHSMSESERNGS